MLGAPMDDEPLTPLPPLLRAPNARHELTHCRVSPYADRSHSQLRRAQVVMSYCEHVNAV